MDLIHKFEHGSYYMFQIHWTCQIPGYYPYLLGQQQQKKKEREEEKKKPAMSLALFLPTNMLGMFILPGTCG